MHTSTNKAGHATVDKAMQILDYLANEEKPAGISKIANALSISKTTVFRILNTLSEWKAVEIDSDGNGYRIGVAMIMLGGKASQKLRIVESSKTIINRIGEELEENVSISIKVEDVSCTVYTYRGNISMITSKQMPVSPLYCSASGKIFLSVLDKNELERYFSDSKTKRRTEHTITSLSEFEKEKVDILRDDISYDNEEYSYGLSCIAVPIKNREGIPVMTVSVSGPVRRIVTKKNRIISLLREYRKELEMYSSYIESII